MCLICNLSRIWLSPRWPSDYYKCSTISNKKCLDPDPGDKNISIFHSSCRTSDLQFFTRPANACTCPLKAYICNKEHKGVICNETSWVILHKALLLQDECFGKNYSSFLDFTRNYKRTSGIFVPWDQTASEEAVWSGSSDKHFVNSSPDNQHFIH